MDRQSKLMPNTLERLSDVDFKSSNYELSESQSKPQFNDLPNELITYILRLAFPIQKLLPFCTVCQRWKELIDRICQGMTSLKLFGSQEELENYVEESLIPNDLHNCDLLNLKCQITDDDFIVSEEHWGKLPLFLLLPQRFLAVSNLVLHFEYTANHSDVPLLVEQFSPQLTSLTISGTDSMTNHDNWLAFGRRMLNAIQNCTSLKKLYILSESLPLPVDSKDSSNDIFAKLQTIFSHFNSNIPIILRKLGESCTDITLRTHSEDGNPQLLSFFSANEALTNNLSHLKLYYGAFYNEISNSHYNLKGLRHLELHFNFRDPPRLNQLPLCLLALPQVTNLTLDTVQIDFSVELCNYASLIGIDNLKIGGLIYVKSDWNLNNLLDLLSFVFPNTKLFSIDGDYGEDSNAFSIEALKCYFRSLQHFGGFFIRNVAEIATHHFGRHSRHHQLNHS